MKMITQFKINLISRCCLLLLLGGQTLVAGKIVSEHFSASVGYGPTGYTSEGVPIDVGWHHDEPQSDNADSKNFKIEVAVTSSGLSRTGPGFTGGALTEVTGGGHCAMTTDFQVAVTASYLGNLPADAKADPRMRIRIHIEKISIYAAALQEAEDPKLWFVEATDNHSQEQAAQEYPSTGFILQENYTPLEWQPPSFLSPVGQTVQRRFFTLGQSASNGNDTPFFAIDGLQVSGTVEVVYESKP